MDSLRILILSGCLKLDKLPEDLGRIKSLTELHADRTAITEVPSFVSSLINLESLSFGGQGRIQPKWWTSITTPFGLLSKQQHPPMVVFGLGHRLRAGILCDRIYGSTLIRTALASLASISETVDGCKKLEEWKKANSFATFCFEENNEDIEVKECGARLVCDEDLEQDDTSLRMLQNLSTLSQHGGALRLSVVGGEIIWSC
ncbi:NB-ARC domains-containing protein [Tanacetum coccineum]